MTDPQRIHRTMGRLIEVRTVRANVSARTGALYVPAGHYETTVKQSLARMVGLRTSLSIESDPRATDKILLYPGLSTEDNF